MSKPKFDGWHGGNGCKSKTCPASDSKKTVHHVNVIDAMYMVKSDDGPFDWPPNEGVTHMCTKCGFSYYGVADAFARRRDADLERERQAHEESNARHEELIETGYDPVCGDSFTSEGWDRVVRELTPVRALCVSVGNMPADATLDQIAFFADHHVPGIGRNFVQHTLPDVIDRHAVEWGHPLLVEYDAFTEKAADFM